VNSTAAGFEAGLKDLKPMEIEAKQYKKALASCQTMVLNGSLCCYKTCKAIIERYSNKLMLILSFFEWVMEIITPSENDILPNDETSFSRVPLPWLTDCT